MNHKVCRAAKPQRAANSHQERRGQEKASSLHCLQNWMRPLCPPSQKREREEDIPASWIEGAKPQGHKHLLRRSVSSAAKSLRAWSQERQGFQAEGGRSWSLKALACRDSRPSAARHRDNLRRQLGGEIRSRAGTQAPGPPPAGRPSSSERKAGGRQSCSETQELGLLFWLQDGAESAHNAQCWNSLFGRKNSCTSGKG